MRLPTILGGVPLRHRRHVQNSRLRSALKSASRRLIYFFFWKFSKRFDYSCRGTSLIISRSRHFELRLYYAWFLNSARYFCYCYRNVATPHFTLKQKLVNWSAASVWFRSVVSDCTWFFPDQIDRFDAYCYLLDLTQFGVCYMSVSFCVLLFCFLPAQAADAEKSRWNDR